MKLNLISDPWIPVRCGDGSQKTIAPWQIALPGIAFPDWPRADLNIACLELLIGLVLLADPPAHDEEWEDRQRPDPDRMKARLAPFAPAFELLGDGPRFLQDLGPLDGEPNTPDMLFLDSAGGNAMRNNTDLMVWRGRYGGIAPALAAMALYTFQAFAPAGGAGNRTSMRGGGPMVTLVDPRQGLWPLVWANVPYGAPATMADLPWTKPARTSEKGRPETFPQHAHPVESFFGMPRRLRLIGDDTTISGVVQRPFGTNYAGWLHPLSPYYRQKAGDGWLPKHPRPGGFSYRNWLGIVMAEPNEEASLRRRAEMVHEWGRRSMGRRARLIVAGWAMDNMKPLDFIFARPPLVVLDEDARDTLQGMVEAAEQVSLALRAALATVVAEGQAREAVREDFFARTGAGFERRATTLTAENRAETARGWMAELAQVAMDLFEDRALPGLQDRHAKGQGEVIEAHKRLSANLRGQGKYGKAAFHALGFDPVPARKMESAP